MYQSFWIYFFSWNIPSSLPSVGLHPYVFLSLKHSHFFLTLHPIHISFFLLGPFLSFSFYTQLPLLYFPATLFISYVLALSYIWLQFFLNVSLLQKSKKCNCIVSLTFMNDLEHTRSSVIFLCY